MKLNIDAMTDVQKTRTRDKFNGKLGYVTNFDQLENDEKMFETKASDDGLILSRTTDVVRGNPNKELPFAFEMTYEDFGR